MKKSIQIITGVFLISVCFVSQPINAQEKTQQEIEKEAKLQQIIDAQKKAMQEQQLKSQELERALRETERNASRSTEAVDNYLRAVRVRPSANPNEAFYVTPGQGLEYQFFGRGGGGDAERTTWDFSKNVKESTFSKQYSFDVEKSVGNVSMTVVGDCKAGEIRVQILMPGGKTYSDIVIDEFGNLNWRKTFTISEEENKDKAGEWLFKINAKQATGYFKISLQTY